jgi:hypothetical protein
VGKGHSLYGKEVGINRGTGGADRRGKGDIAGVSSDTGGRAHAWTYGCCVFFWGRGVVEYR